MYCTSSLREMRTATAQNDGALEKSVHELRSPCRKIISNAPLSRLTLGLVDLIGSFGCSSDSACSCVPRKRTPLVSVSGRARRKRVRSHVFDDRAEISRQQLLLESEFGRRVGCPARRA